MHLKSEPTVLFFSPKNLSKRQWFEQTQLEPYYSTIVALAVDVALY